MGCNCVSQEQIKKLHELYGEKVEVAKSQEIGFSLKKIVTKILVGLCVLFIVPFLFLKTLYKILVRKQSVLSVSDFIFKPKNLDVAFAKTIIENTKVSENV